MVMKMKNKKILLVIIIAIIILLSVVVITLSNKSNLVKINYNEIMEKLDNKESFVLCLSASNCVHCQSYKPKLEKIANKYDIVIYYTNIDELNENDYEKLKTKLSFTGGTPTTIFFKNGEEKTTATRLEGDTKTEKILNKLKQNGFITE